MLEHGALRTVLDEPQWIDRSLSLEAHWNDRSDVRTAGWTLFASLLPAGAIASVISTFWMMATAGGDAGTIADGAIALGGAGAVAFLAAFVVGLPLAFHFDDIGVRPRDRAD